MWNSIREALWDEKEEDNNGVVGLQPVLVGSGQQNNEGFINLQIGRAIASGNGPPIYAIIHNIRNYYGFPPLPSYEPPRPSLSLYRSSSKRVFLFSTHWLVTNLDDMKELLVKNFGFPIHCIRVLTAGKEQSPDVNETKENVLKSLEWLVKDCQPGDLLVFYFCGSFRERKIPIGMKSDEKWITEDEIKSIIVGPLKKGVTLHAIVDAIGIGDNDDATPFLDLNYVYKQKNGIYWNWEDNKPNPIHNHTNGGLVICLSTWQLAGAFIMITPKRIHGFWSYLLTKAKRDWTGMTYSSLLNMMHKEIKNRHYESLKFAEGSLRGLALSSSHKFDVSTKIFTM